MSPSQDSPSGADGRQGTRRRFLKQAGAVPAAIVAAQYAGQARGESKSEKVAVQSSMPRIQIGPYSISRLVCGANPFNGGSHLSVFVNHEMKRYYSDEQILKTLRHCEEQGINCWQSGGKNLELYQRYIDAGGKMHFISIEHAGSTAIEKLKEGGCVGVAHHGEVTDRLFKSGDFEKVGDYLKRVKDAGLQAGVSTHMPAVVDAVEAKGWDLDYYMTCVYERHRSAEDLEKLLGQAPIPVGEVYLPLDPPRMFQSVRQTRRPCLAFKILAAGRLSKRKAWVERAFRETYESIKPTDGVIVGIYDRYSDQVAENAAYAREFSSLSRAT